MLLSVATVISATLLLVIAYIYRGLSASRKYEAAAIKHGCQPPVKYPHTDRFWGYDLVKERIAAAKFGRQLPLYMKHFSLYGKTWEENDLGNRVINTMEARNIQHVAAIGFEDWRKPSSAVFRTFLGNGIFSRDGSVWKHSRNLVKPLFSRSELSDVDYLKIHLDRLLDLIPRDGHTIDLQGPINKMFIEASSEFLFGKPMNSQLPVDTDDADEYLQAFETSLIGFGKRRSIGRLHHIYDAFDKSWKRACEKVHAYIDVQVKRALQETEDSENTKSPRYIFLHELAKQIRDPIELRFQLLNVSVPSRDTTALLVGSTIFHLARNPEIWTQLRAESLALRDQDFQQKTFRSLRLFRNVVHETLRLQGPTTRVQRTAIRDTILPVGGGCDGKAPVFVERGTTVSLNIWGLHHDKDIWGEDVDEFKPERWDGRRPAWEFVPFLGGPRICPAQQQVITQSIYVLVRLTAAFARIENRDSVVEYVERWKLLPESQNGIKVAFFP